MSKGAIIIGGAIAALALFYKPITDMLNGIIGGGGGFGDYFNARDTSTSQGPAYDPPNPDAPTPPSDPTLAEKLGLTNYQDYGSGYYGGERTTPSGKKLYIEGNINSGIGDKTNPETGQRFFELGNGLRLYTEASREINPIKTTSDSTQTTDASDTPTDKKGTEKVTTPDPGQQGTGVIDWVKNNPTDAAFLGIFGASPAINTVKWGLDKLRNTKVPAKAYEVLKETTPKVVEKSKALKTAVPRATQLGKNIIKSPIGKGAAIVTAVALLDKPIADLTGKTPVLPELFDFKLDPRSAETLDFKLRNPFESIKKITAPQNKGGSAPSKYVNTQSINTHGIASAPVISAQGGYSPTASWRSSGFSTSGGVTSYMGVKMSAGLTPQNLSPVIAKAIQESKKKTPPPPPPPPKTGGKK